MKRSVPGEMSEAQFRRLSDQLGLAEVCPRGPCLRHKNCRGAGNALDDYACWRIVRDMKRARLEKRDGEEDVEAMAADYQRQLMRMLDGLRAESQPGRSEEAAPEVADEALCEERVEATREGPMVRGL